MKLEHHRAGSDSRACGEILLRHLRAGVSLASFVRRYDLERACTIRKTR